MRTPKPVPEASTGAHSERHYSVGRLAALWDVSPDTIRRLFRNEPGVIVIANQAAHKRRYSTLRIPESVARRVHRKMSLP